MRKPSEKSLTFIQIFFQFIYGLGWFVGVCMILVGVLMPFTPAIKDDFCGVWINFTLSDSEPGFQIGDLVYSTSLTRTTGWLLIDDGPWFLAYFNLIFILVVITVGLFSLNRTIKIVKRVREGKIFLVDNMLDLRRVSIVMVAFFFFLVITRVWVGSYTIGRLVSGPLKETGFLGPSLDLDIGSLIFPLFLWVISEVFRVGIELKVDQDLTV
jgi:hypothetical protein